MGWRVIEGDCREVLRELPGESVQCCVTSPPYFGLRDYGHEGQLGLEATPDEYVAGLVEVFRDVRRVLRDDGTVWLNLGDSWCSSPPGNVGEGFDKWKSSGLAGVREGSRYIDTLNGGTNTKRDTSRLPGLKQKDLIGIPWRVAFALQADGWWLRQEIIWHKLAPMPESVKDRCTRGHEQVFMLSKRARYYYDADAIKEPATDVGRDNGRDGRSEDERARPPGSRARTLARLDCTDKGRNKRSVWTLGPQQYADAHFAVMPSKLVEPCVLAGTPEGGTILDPFAGAGTTGLVALRHQRSFLGIELNPDYVEMARRRIIDDAPLLNQHSEQPSVPAPLTATAPPSEDAA